MSENRRNVFTSKNHLKIHNGELEMTGNLLYRNSQMMALESSIKTGNVKSFKFLVSTPLELFRRLRLDAELIGDMNSLTSSLNLELEPIMGKIQILSALSRIGGLSGNVKLITSKPLTVITPLLVMPSLFNEPRLENREPLKAGLFIYHLKVGGTKIDQVALFAYLHFPDA
jgi:hypothetical protein